MTYAQKPQFLPDQPGPAVTSRGMGMPRQAVSAGSSARSGSNAALGRRRGRVPKRELLTFSSQLAIMTRTGVDLASALESLTRQCGHPALKQILSDVNREVNGGSSIAEALGRHSAVFGPSYVATVAAGEASGRLPEVLEQLSRLQRGELRLRSTVRSLLAYPVLLASASLLVIVGLVLFVLPQFAQIFADYELSLPLLTQIMIGVADELRGHWWIWGPGFLLLITGLYMFVRSTSGRQLVDRLLLDLRVLRGVTRALFIGRTCRLLGIMLSNGVPLLESLRLARASLTNSLYQELFRTLERDVLNGNGLGEGLLKSPFVPSSASEMIYTAEKTGTLGMVALMLGEHYEEEAEARLREVVAILEPAITIGMGILVAIVVLSVMLPMFDLATLAQG